MLLCAYEWAPKNIFITKSDTAFSSGNSLTGISNEHIQKSAKPPDIRFAYWIDENIHHLLARIRDRAGRFDKLSDRRGHRQPKAAGLATGKV